MVDLIFKFECEFVDEDIKKFLLYDLRMLYLGDDIKNIELVEVHDG